MEKQELQFTYECDDSISGLHEGVNDSFIHPEESEKSSLGMEELHRKIEADKNRRKESVAPIQPETKELLPETQEEIAFYKPKDSTSVKAMTEETDVKVQHEDADKTEALSAAHTESEAHTEAIETNISSDVAITHKEVSQPEELICGKKAEVEQPQPLNPGLPQPCVTGQFHSCCTSAEDKKDPYIVDQHTAQECYHYEIIKKQILNGSNDTQPLLLPITIESMISAASQADDSNALLEQPSIHLEVFGNHVLAYRQLPLWMEDVGEEAFLCDMIDIWEKGKEVSLDELRKHAIATMACHSPVRLDRSPTLDRMKHVVEDLAHCGQSFHCLHGKPAMICTEDKALIHEFERG